MADAIIVQIAEAVKEALNGATTGTFSQNFEAERSYADWELALEDSQEPTTNPKVDVVPVSIVQTDIETRGSITYSPAIDIVVRLRLGPERREAGGKFSLPEIDALVLFVEQINEFFSIDRLAGFDSAAWDADVGTRILAAFKPTHLRQYHQFTGIIRLAFKAQQTIS